MQTYSTFQNNEATIPKMSNQLCKMESRPQVRVDEHPGMRTSKVGPWYAELLKAYEIRLMNVLKYTQVRDRADRVTNNAKLR
jgi:hypothetical protein